MFRIIDGIIFEGKPSADTFAVTTVDLGHGHFEACVQRVTEWKESGPLDPDSILAQVLRGERDDPNEEEKREANRRRAARRAKTNVRRRCKAQGLDTLLTLTYKANQVDLDLAKLHLKLFLEKIRRAYREAGLAEFRFVGCFEQQKRGAWHVHLATQKLPVMLHARNGVKVKSWNVIRAIWRTVVGELEGNIDVGRKKAQKSAAKCASYISKYVLKMCELGEDHKARYTWSRAEVPKPTREEFKAASLADLIGMVVQVAAEKGASLATSWLSKFGDVFFVASENRSDSSG